MASPIHHKQLFGFAGRWQGFSDRNALREYAAAQDDGPRAPSADGRAPGESLAAARFVHETPDLIVAIAGDPYRPDDSGRRGRADTNPAAEAARDYLRFADQSVERIHGSFALAIVDSRSATTLLAVDRMGIERLAYAIAADSIVFGSSVDSVARFPPRASRLRPQALFDFLLMHMVPSPDTVYEGVHKLRAGTCVIFRNGRLETKTYWNPEFVESGPCDIPPLGIELRERLRGAVADCLPDDNTGAFLSGGLDSSTVAGMLCAVRARPAATFSIGFGVDAYDELKYARIASRRFGTVSHEYNVTPADIVSALPRIAQAYDEPFGNSSAVPTYFCAKLAAEHGMTHLLAGDGGDEIFGGNERYARQKVFEAYHRLPQALRSHVIEPFSSLISPESRLTPLRKLRSYVDQARIPMPERLESWNFMYRTDLDAMLDPEFRAAIDTRYTLRLMAEVYGQGRAASLVNRMLYYDWQYTLADNDLRKVGTMCRIAGLRVSYPLLHDRVVELSVAIPPHWKVRGINLRASFKKAMAGFLPEEIIDKKKHGFGLPFGVWLKTDKALADLIYSLLSDLKSRRLVRPTFLDHLIADQRAGHPSYFGYAIWDLAMLEAWLATHVDRR